MSYSRTHGYPRGAKTPGTNPNESDERSYGEQDMQTTGQTTEPPSRVERKDGFTMFRPDERKRAHLEQVAKRETEEANARHEARRPQHVRERPCSVGGAVNYSTAIMQKQKAVTAASSGLEIQKKREKWQREKKEAEEKEYRERKEKARAQAERNEVLRVVRAQELEERHRESHRWKNQEFLDRLERGSRFNGY